MEKANNKPTGKYPYGTEESGYEGFGLDLHGFCNGCPAFDVTADWVMMPNIGLETTRYWVVSCSHKKVCGQIRKFIERKYQHESGKTDL